MFAGRGSTPVEAVWFCTSRELHSRTTFLKETFHFSVLISIFCVKGFCVLCRDIFIPASCFLSHQFSFALTKETLRNFIPEKSQILSFLFALWEWSFWAPVVRNRAAGPLPALESRCVGSWTSAVQKLLVWSANKPDSSRLLCLLWSQNAFLPRPEFLWLYCSLTFTQRPSGGVSVLQEVVGWNPQSGHNKGSKS